jgi:hypothetical protein
MKISPKVSMLIRCFVLSTILLWALNSHARQFALPLTLSDGTHQLTLQVGIHPTASFNYVDGLDILSPPPPPGGLFDARIIVQDENYLRKFLPHPGTLPQQFRLVYRPQTGQQAITVGWATETLPEEWQFSVLTPNDLQVVIEDLANHQGRFTPSLENTALDRGLIIRAVLRVPASFTVDFDKESDGYEIYLDPQERDFQIIIEWTSVEHAKEYELVGLLFHPEMAGKVLEMQQEEFDFSVPDFIIPSDEDGNLPRVTLNYEILDKVLFDAAVLPGEKVHFVWAIRAKGLGGQSYSNPSAVGTIKRHHSAPNPLSLDPDVQLPMGAVLHQNYPNPFNPGTQIRFELPEATHVRLHVYTVDGRLTTVLLDGSLASGYHQLGFDASRLAGGLYLLRLQTPEATLTRKMLLLK